VFTVEERDRVRRALIERAELDERLVSAAVVGSEAAGTADRWADLDLTFALSDEASLDEVLADWTRALDTEFDAPALFDVWAGPSIYRVFLLPGNLQVDLSFTPAARFGPTSTRFRLIFGEIREHRAREPMSRLAQTPRQRFGLCILYLVRTRIYLERSDLERAEQYLKWAAELVESGEARVPPTPTRAALLSAMRDILARVLRDPGEGAALAERLRAQLRELTRPTLDAS
jgi:predicted nucleotidyltransferase